MKEVLCYVCGNGTGLMRHDTHIIHNAKIMCRKCAKTPELSGEKK